MQRPRQQETNLGTTRPAGERWRGHAHDEQRPEARNALSNRDEGRLRGRGAAPGHRWRHPRRGAHRRGRHLLRGRRLARHGSSSRARRHRGELARPHGWPCSPGCAQLVLLDKPIIAAVDGAAYRRRLQPGADGRLCAGHAPGALLPELVACAWAWCPTSPPCTACRARWACSGRARADALGTRGGRRRGAAPGHRDGGGAA